MNVSMINEKIYLNYDKNLNFLHLKKKKNQSRKNHFKKRIITNLFH